MYQRNILNTSFTESQDKSSKLQSQVDLLNVDVEKQKLEHEETMHNAQKDLSSTIVNLELRQAELTERLKVSTLRDTTKHVISN